MTLHGATCRRVAIALAAALAFAVQAGSAHAAGHCGIPTGRKPSTSALACWRPFTAVSPFNIKLPANPKLAADSSAVQQHMADYGWSLDGSKSGFMLSGEGSRTVYFASPSDPTMTISCTNPFGPTSCHDAQDHPLAGTTLHVPAGARSTNNWDAHMTIIETNTGEEYDFWHASVSGNTLTAGTGAVSNVNTSDGTTGGGDAAGFSLTAGLLRPAELASGHIDHALVITAPCTNASGANVGYTWPAGRGSGEYCGQYWNERATDAPMLGQLVRLNMTDAQIASSGAPTWQQTIMTTLAHYGAYIEDTNGSGRDEGMYILAQDPASWTNLGQTNQWATAINQLGGTGTTLTSKTPIPTAKLQLVDTCVTHGTCPNASTGQPSANGTSRHRPLAIAAGASHKRSGARDKKRPASRHRTRRSGRRVERRDVEGAAVKQTAFARRGLGT